LDTYNGDWKTYQDAYRAALNTANDSPAAQKMLDDTAGLWAKTDADFAQLIENADHEASLDNDAISVAYTSSQQVMIPILLLTLVIGGGLTWIISRTTANTANQVAAAAAGLAVGDLNQTIDV